MADPQGSDAGINSTDDVSIVIPAFNAADTITSALASVSTQAGPIVEILVVDDGSEDDTSVKVGGMARQDPRIKLLQNKENMGPGYSRNRGIAASRGTWVGFLDADDRYEPGRIESLMEAADGTAADIVADNQYMIAEGSDETFRLLFERAPRLWLLTVRHFVAENMPGRHGTLGLLKPLIRSEFLDTTGLRYDESLRFGEDYRFMLRCLLEGSARVVVVGDPLYRYRMRRAGLTASVRPQDIVKLIELNSSVIVDMGSDRPGLRSTLERRHELLSIYLAHRRAVDALRSHRYADALRHVVANPRLTIFLLVSIGRLLNRRAVQVRVDVKSALETPAVGFAHD